MTDPHLRILAAAARQSQRKLDEHDGSEAAKGGPQRRLYLSDRMKRTKSRLAAARARRGLPPLRPRASGLGGTEHR